MVLRRSRPRHRQVVCAVVQRTRARINMQLRHSVNPVVFSTSLLLLKQRSNERVRLWITSPSAQRAH